VQDEDFATTNLISYSESFDVGWTAVGATVAANDIVAPDGASTADKIVESSGGTYHFLETQSVSFSAATHTVSVYAKYNGRQFLTMQGTSARIGTNVASFDLSDGSVAFASAGTSASIDDAGDGWYRLQWSVSATAGTGTVGFFLADQSGVRDDTYSGDGVSGVYLWGASLTATEYPVAYTSTRNLLTDSQDFERSGWVKSNTAVDDDAAQAPDGTLTADKLKETIATGQFQATQNVNKTGQFVASAYFKADERSKVYIQSILSVGGIYVVFDLNAETASAFNYGGAALPTAVITNVGNGWYRCSMSMSASATVTNTRFSIANDAGGTSYTGIDGYGVYLWGAQLEPGTTATDYVRTVDVVGKDYGFYEPTEGTLLASSTRYSNDNAYQRVVTVASSGGTNQFAILKFSTQEAGYLASPGLQVNKPLVSAGTEMRSVFAAKIGNHAFTINGAIPATDSTAQGLGSGMEALFIGQSTGGSQIQNGHIKRLTYWPVRQADSTLQVITQ
jgi:hypothetical protein